jgi:selenocysteine-specific elongation factor
MDVVATAGHVDHGKSALVRALTGMEPDRWAEEQRRGMTIDLGFAWTTLPTGQELAFVDVPGHERFVTNMLAGVGPVPAVLLVVAADEGWRPQTAEHVAALDALGVEHALVALTKSDVADPDPVRQDVLERLQSTSLRTAETVAVSARTGAGLETLRGALSRLVTALPRPEVEAPVRLWIDRAFTIRGAGTVVTGTLPAGRLQVGDELELHPAGRRVVVRALQSRKQQCEHVDALARVAVNLRGVDRDDVSRGMALTTPGAWCPTRELDVLAELPSGHDQLVVHVGAAAVPARLRRLDAHAVRIQMASTLPLHLGDRLLLREPSTRELWTADVAELEPRPLRRRGDAQRVGAQLRLPASADDLVERHGLVTGRQLRAWGVGDSVEHGHRVGGWHVAERRWQELLAALRALVAADADPLSRGLPLGALCQSLRLPDPELLTALVADCPDLVLRDGHVRSATAAHVGIAPQLQPLVDRLAADPLAAPDLEEVRRLDPGALAHAVRAGALRHLGGGVYVAPHAPELAQARLATLPQPFTVSAARQALGSSRRVVVPLLEHLDAARVTRKLDDGTRLLVAARG